jgi:tripartite-type tricarboxylate transporter receptor subunit TctC
MNLSFRHCHGRFDRAAKIAPLLFFCGLATFAGAASAAEAYPSKPIRIIHGYGSGSSMDTNARAIADRLTPLLGQQVIVESRPGATGMIANEAVARAAPDGYTLLAAPSSAVTATPHLRKGFDPSRDVVPVALIGEFAFMLAAHPAVPAKNARELIALGKRKRDGLSYGSTGVGSAYHLAGVLFTTMAGIEMLHVPYRGGGAAAITDLVAGRVDLAWNSPVFLLPHVRSGRIRAIGVTGPRRIAAASDVPTISESGLPGYEMVGWQGMLAPAGTPAEIVNRLNGTIGKVLTAPETRKVWENSGLEPPIARTAEQFDQILRADYAKYGKLIKRIGISNIE